MMDSTRNKQDKMLSILLMMSGLKWWWKQSHLLLSLLLFIVWLVIIMSPFLMNIIWYIENASIESHSNKYYPIISDVILYMMQIAFPSFLFIASHNYKKNLARVVVRLITIGILIVWCGVFAFNIAMANQNSMGEKLDLSTWEMYVELWYFVVLLITMFVPRYWKVK